MENTQGEIMSEKNTTSLSASCQYLRWILFPIHCVDHREILQTITLYLCSRSNSNNLGFYSWKPSLCQPANTYQIISSEATKTEIQHIKGTKWGYHRATIMLCRCLSMLSAASVYNYKAINRVSREQRKLETQDRNEHTYEQISLMRWKVWGVKRKVRRARETHKPCSTSGLEMPVQDLNRWKRLFCPWEDRYT